MVTKISLIFECAIFQLIVFFTVKGNLFSFMARIRITTVLWATSIIILRLCYHLFLLIHAND